LRVCADCGGDIYRSPRWKAYQIIQLARQINKLKEIKGELKLKIKRYTSLDVCREKAKSGEGFASITLPLDGGDPEIIPGLESEGDDDGVWGFEGGHGGWVS